MQGFKDNFDKSFWVEKLWRFLHFYILIINEKAYYSFMWKMTFEIFIKYLHWENSFFDTRSKKKVLWIKEGFVNLKKFSLIQRNGSVYIKENFVWINKTFFDSKKIVFSPYSPTSDKNGQNRSIFCVVERNFIKKSKISILVSDSSHEFLLIVLITFFDQTKIRKVTVC